MSKIHDHFNYLSIYKKYILKIIEKIWEEMTVLGNDLSRS